ncbi:hypothetical protein BCR44DRAFT_1436889 [Catenaria anguillulae PL171]|uniref:Uncharacterized protein n=1 Tax=Catenaria anguillulae PL171 TaxID=765915 RepID=A0A1Y2HI76_9FUNG|nr:hypothetical protein BCR44DRAFT_1436889 [Catenaria anguillulae PL171]
MLACAKTQHIGQTCTWSHTDSPRSRQRDKPSAYGMDRHIHIDPMAPLRQAQHNPQPFENCRLLIGQMTTSAEAIWAKLDHAGQGCNDLSLEPLPQFPAAPSYVNGFHDASVSGGSQQGDRQGRGCGTQGSFLAFPSRGEQTPKRRGHGAGGNRKR